MPPSAFCSNKKLKSELRVCETLYLRLEKKNVEVSVVPTPLQVKNRIKIIYKTHARDHYPWQEGVAQRSRGWVGLGRVRWAAGTDGQ